MKRTAAVPAIVIILMATAACASKTYGPTDKQTMSISDWSTSPFPEKGAINITFDDGRQNQYDNAWPLLKARGIVAAL